MRRLMGENGMPISVQNLSDAEKVGIVREAYRKHAQELLAIEDAQVKLTAVLLGIFGAGCSFLAAMKQGLPLSTKLGLTIIAVSLELIGYLYTRKRNHARTWTRGLLVRCEQVLGFYEPNAFVPNESLYNSDLVTFPQRGTWLGAVSILVGIVGIGFLVLLWST